MLENIQSYLSKQGVKYIKPEKAGPHKEEMEDLKALGQAARKEMQALAKLLEERLAPFKMDRVSNWAIRHKYVGHTFGAITGPLRIV